MSNELDELTFLLNASVDEVRNTSFSRWQGLTDNSSAMKGFTGEAELAVGSVQGYRWWKMYPMKQDALIGAYGGRWDPGDAFYEGECRRARLYGKVPEHAAPEPSCGCGFWAFWKPADASVILDKTAITIQGVVEGFGTVLIGDKGFRCGKVRLKGLAIDKDHLRRTMEEERKRNFDGYFTQTYKNQLTAGPWRSPTFKTEGAVNTHAQITGRKIESAVDASIPEEILDCAVAEIEGTLEELYPSVKVFCSMSTMRTYFGHDKNYGYASSRCPDVLAMGQDWLQRVLLKLTTLSWDLGEALWETNQGWAAAREVRRMGDLVREIIDEL
jgi:hypothetical protein